MSDDSASQQGGCSQEDAQMAPVGKLYLQENDPRRTACTICRKRKLRCDGAAPECGRCSRLGHECSYDQASRKHKHKQGSRKGYVKRLEIRLAQVESLLRTDTSAPVSSLAQPSIEQEELNDNGIRNFDEASMPDMAKRGLCSRDTFITPMTTMFYGPRKEPTWELMELGLDEPLPLPEVLAELTEIFFLHIHPQAPIIHQYRFLAAMSLSPQARPPIALRYAMWLLAASVTIKYSSLTSHFYHRARKYAEAVELLGHGEKLQNVTHIQAEILIAIYEFKSLHLPRAWLRTGRAVRMAQMMKLHRVDSEKFRVKKCLPPARDFIEQEEWRRTFWLAFCLDRHATTGTGWPMIIEERDIFTNLPCSEEAFEQGLESSSMSLSEARAPTNAARLSPFAGVVAVISIFGHTLTHLHRPSGDDREEEANGPFWRRHRDLDGTLLNIFLFLPAHLKMPFSSSSLPPTSNTVLLNMCLHAATICLHQVAIFKAQKYGLQNVVDESRMRCQTAATEIASIMRSIVHMDLTSMNLILPFCLFVGARIFLHTLKTQPEYENSTGPSAQSTLQFLLLTMAVLRSTNPLADSFLVQLELELDGTTTGITMPPRYASFDDAAMLLPDDPADGTPWVKIRSPLVEIVDGDVPQASMSGR